ncbi:hypothetical protein JCM8097_001194 [Rhodosporidiobolus ruineniae]
MNGYGYPSPGQPPLKRQATDDHYPAPPPPAAYPPPPPPFTTHALQPNHSQAASTSGGSSGSATPQPYSSPALSHLNPPTGAGFDSYNDGQGDGADGGSAGGGGGGGGRKTKTGQPPLKRGSACQLCRKRKLRCDGVRPKCGTCLRLNHDCQYGDPTQERIHERQRELEDKCRALEAELEAYRRHGPPGAGAATASLPSLSAAVHVPAPAPGMPLDSPSYPPPSAAAYPPTSHLQPSPTAYPFPTPQLPQQHPQPYPASPLHPPPTGAHFPFYPPAPAPGVGPGASPFGPPTTLSPLHAPAGIPPPAPAQRRDSEAFPLPPSSSAAAASTAGVQSFPWAVSNTAGPGLSDLINPPSASSGGGAGPMSGTSPTLGGGLQLDGQQGVQGATGEEGGTMASVWGTELPDLEVMLDLADIYFSTLHIHLPFLHRRRFLYTLHHPSSLTSAPSLSLIFSVLAISAQYHDSPALRALSSVWYQSARGKVEAAIAAGLRPSGSRVASLTVETVQALCLLALVEVGLSDHQRAFLSIGQAVRISVMLGLHRMDEDRVAARTGQMEEKRLKPPALHLLPKDGVLLEECRRTMCTVFLLDRFECATVGWPAAITETDLRVLLPCADALFDAGAVDPDGRDNPLWWPADGVGTSREMGWQGIREEELASPTSGGAGSSEGEGIKADGAASPTPQVGTFAWLCRVVWLGGRIQMETYRARGPPAGGPWNKASDADPLGNPESIREMDVLLEYVRTKFGNLAAQKAKEEGKVESGVLLILLLVNCMFVNLFHLHASSGLSALPWDPSAPIYIGSAEYSMKRCWEAVSSLHQILAQLAAYENSRTSLHRSRATTFTSFLPYVNYAIAFPAKFAIGDWNLLVVSRDRAENVPASVQQDLTSGDDAFPPSYFDERLAFVDVACDAMERNGTVWPIGQKFAAMVRGDRMRLANRTYDRQQAAAASAGSINPISTTTVTSSGLSPFTSTSTPGTSTSPLQPLNGAGSQLYESPPVGTTGLPQNLGEGANGAY